MPRAKTDPKPRTWPTSPPWCARMRAGERRAISRAVTELERLSAAAPRLLQAMQPHLGHGPGGGLHRAARAPANRRSSTPIRSTCAAQGRSVGIIAVDPSSPVSGGAILGDRIRMTATLDDDGVFMRSLASRGHLGGLSPAAVRVIDALDAAGKDLILIETVGTGQSEIDVAEVADVRVLVTAPGLGDDIQAMKAGLLEIADVMVVNKADREGADRTVQQLKGALSLQRRTAAEGAGAEDHATTGEGIGALAAAIAEVAARRRRRRTAASAGAGAPAT